MFPFLPCRFFLALYRKEPVGCCSQRSGGEYQMQPCTEQVPGQGWKQHSYTVPPWARWAAPHGTHREHHSWENTVKLPNASPTLVLSTRDSTLAACSYWNSQGRVCMDTSAACCGFCAMKLLGSHVQWLSAREEGLPLAHLGTKMTEDWTVSCL